MINRTIDYQKPEFPAGPTVDLRKAKGTLGRLRTLIAPISVAAWSLEHGLYDLRCAVTAEGVRNADQRIQEALTNAERVIAELADKLAGEAR